MRSTEDNIGSIVLCGGEARRMAGCDKPLQLWGEQPLVVHVLSALSDGPVVISANRSLETYKTFGFPVVTDQSKKSYEGPLAGVAAAAEHFATTASIRPKWLYIVPGDAPRLPPELAKRLRECCLQNGAPAACVRADRLHPLPLLVQFSQLTQLTKYLATGKRSVFGWLETLNHATLDLAGEEIEPLFANINTPQELAALNEIQAL